MADAVLEERINNIEQIIERIGEGLNQGVAQSNTRFAHLESLLDRFAEENRRGIADLRQEMGNLSRRLGTIIEDFVAPDLPRILRTIVPCPENEDILVNMRVRRRHPTQKGRIIEIDALADCGQYVLCNETKSRLRSEHIQDFLEKLTIVRDYFPEYQQHQIIGCVASLHVDQSLVNYAARQGLLVLALGEGLMGIRNKPEFQWRTF